MRVTIISAILSLFAIVSYAQEEVGTLHIDSIDYTTKINTYNRFFSQNPSSLIFNEMSNWSYIGASYHTFEGDYRNPQITNNGSVLSVNTESILNLRDKGWAFYGKFEYVNGGCDSLDGNISFRLPENGSPYYDFLQKAGPWDFQKYQLKGAVAKRLSEKLTLGVAIDYTGNLYFRIQDIRNEITELVMDLNFSLSYMVNENNSLSLGGIYLKEKKRPSYSTKYQHGADSYLYTIYINAGLGTYIKPQNDLFPTISYHDDQYGGSAQWLYNGDNAHYSVSASYLIGQNMVDDRRQTDLSENEISDVLVYDYSKMNLSLATHNRVGASDLYGYAFVTMVSGEGKNLNYNTNEYINNYTADIMQFGFEITYISDGSLLRKISINANYDSQAQFDRSYGYSYEWSNIIGGANFELYKRLNSSNALSLTLGGYYKMSLSHKLDEGAAIDNLYTTIIAQPTMGYLASDYYSAIAEVMYKTQFMGYIFEFNLAGGYTKPLTIHEPQFAHYDLDSDNFNVNFGVKIFF